jgi:DNA-binding SARP family transcriptional activator
VGRHLTHGRARSDFAAIERQPDYQLSRLTVTVAELNRLTQAEATTAISRILADLDSGECTNAGIEAVHRLRLWQADYLRLAAELEAATRSFLSVEQELRRQLDTVLADWERRFESARPAGETAPLDIAARVVLGRRRKGPLRGLFQRGYDRTPPVAPLRAPAAEQFEPANELVLPADTLDLAPEAYGTDIAALVLGPFELTVAGSRVLKWTSLKARAIFQYLLIHRDRPVRRDVLMSLQWPQHSYSSARNNLNVALCNLRNTLDWTGLGTQPILHKGGCYLLNPDLVCWVDRNEFLAKVHEARRARETENPEQAIKAARSAISLYRGPLFEDNHGGDWYLTERRQLKELYLQALEYLGGAYYERRQFAEAIEFGQRTMSADPCYEPGHRLLMRCYARQNQQQLVSRQYRLCAAALQDELDVSPAAETVQLFRTLTSAS